MADKPGLQAQFQRPFSEQIAYLRNKLNLPTSRFDDIRKAAHDKAFIISGAEKADLINDMHRAVEGRIEAGEGLDEFRRDFKKIVERHGWHGWTGEDTKKGEAWRTRVIYETNLRTSYAAGRYQQLKNPNLVKVAPYWQYIHSDHVKTPRPQHKAWGDERLTLPHDHPFWDVAYPPNGYGCRCTVTAVVAPSSGAATSLPEGWDAPDPKTGAPPGIDKDWDYAPGASTDASLRQMVQDKLITYPPAISKALTRDINRWIEADADAVAFARRALEDRGLKQDLWLGFASAAGISNVAKVDVSSYFVLIPADTVRHVHDEHSADARGQRAVTADDYRGAASWLHEGVVARSTRPGSNGATRLECTWKDGDEEVRSIWEVRGGKRNRALLLVTFYVKSLKSL